MNYKCVTFEETVSKKSQFRSTLITMTFLLLLFYIYTHTYLIIFKNPQSLKLLTDWK